MNRVWTGANDRAIEGHFVWDELGDEDADVNNQETIWDSRMSQSMPFLKHKNVISSLSNES